MVMPSVKVSDECCGTRMTWKVLRLVAVVAYSEWDRSRGE